MFRANTVLVIGAGASAEFDFPLGGALLKDIAKRIDISYQFGRQERGDQVVAEALRKALNASEDVALYNDHLHSAWQVAASAKQGLSIDNVLHALEDKKATKVGKFGIVRSILHAEKQSPLKDWVDHSPQQIEIEKFDHTWLSARTKVLTEGRTKSEIGEIFDNLTIVNFNYDRIIEQYLPFAVSNYYGLKPDDIREVMKGLRILRPYGKAGALPWEGAENSVGFGHCSADDIIKAAEQNLTFTEQVEDQELVNEIEGAFSGADRILFLGFGYHRQNIELLSNDCQPHVQILGTSLGYRNQIGKLYLRSWKSSLAFSIIQFRSAMNMFDSMT